MNHSQPGETMDEQVKLLGTWASPYNMRVEMALKLKGVRYEYIEEDLSNKSDLLLRYNPVHQKIPLLLHNGKPLAESIVILEYIDETWKQTPLLPKDPYERARARFLAKFIDEKLMGLTIKTVVGTKEEREKAMEEYAEQLRFLDRELEGKRFFGGQSVGFLDVVATIIGLALARTGEALGMPFITEENCPEICKWAGRMYELEPVRDCIPPKQKHLEYIRRVVQTMQVAEDNANKMRVAYKDPTRELFNWNRGETMGQELKLLGNWASPFSLRVEIALKLKGVPYRYIEQDLTNKSDMLLEYNPVHQKVPVMLHNGKPLAESTAILEYIDETWKQPPLLPQDTYERAMVRFLGKLIDENLAQLTLKVISGSREVRQQALGEFQEHMRVLERELQGKDFFGGKTIGFVDIVAIIIPFWLGKGMEIVGCPFITVENCPEICRWTIRMLGDLTVRGCIPPVKKLLEPVRKWVEATKAANENVTP